jgi:very-short-patch-repair endonuclease
MAAALAHGPLAVLSHRTAAAVHALLRSSTPTAHVTVPANGRRKRRGIVLHQAALAEHERTLVDNLPVTTVARTLLDLAADNDPLLHRAIEEAEHLRLLDIKAVDLDSKRPGVRNLRHALTIYRPGPAWTRSEFERRFLKELRRAGLPLPAVNAWIDRYEVDCVWWDQKLIVELDGGDYHDTTAARERDPQRDADLQLKGFRILRITDRRLDQEPAAVMALIRDFLSRAARTPARPGR